MLFLFQMGSVMWHFHVMWQWWWCSSGLQVFTWSGEVMSALWLSVHGLHSIRVGLRLLPCTMAGRCHSRPSCQVVVDALHFNKHVLSCPSREIWCFIILLRPNFTCLALFLIINNIFLCFDKQRITYYISGPQHFFVSLMSDNISTDWSAASKTKMK